MKSRLKNILKEYGITQKDFKAHIATHKPRSEDWAKAILQNKTALNFKTVQIVIESLRELTGQDIFLQDVIDLPYDKYKHVHADNQVSETSLELVALEDNEEERLWAALYEFIDKDSIPHNPNRRVALWVLPLLLVCLLLGFIGGRQITLPRNVTPLGGSANIPVPHLIGPEGHNLDLTPKLRVEAVPRANDYEFSVFNLLSRKNIFIANTPNPFYNLPKNLLCPNTPYGWKARAGIQGQWSSFASTMEFIIENNHHPWNIYAEQDTEPTIPHILEPDKVVTSLPVTLKLSEVEDAIGYGFYLRDLETEHLYDFEYNSTSNEFIVPEGVIQDGHRYGWNARARNCAGFSGFTDRLEFQVNLSD